MPIPIQYQLAESLESHLGDPFDPSNPFSFRRAVELDEAEAYPEEACRLLNGFGLQRHYVPARLGGDLESFEELQMLMRLAARRDLSAATAHAMTLVASTPVWVGADAAQQARLARIVLEAGQVAIGLHEKDHGNDLLACQVEARRVEGGYLLEGEKWCIGNPLRAAALVIFARTSSSGGPRGFSLFLLEKSKLDPSSFSGLPKIRTSGVRGHEVAGVRFHNCYVNEETLLPPQGSGLEIVLKSSQITRVLAVAECLGALDSALRVTLDFALERRLYGRTVFSIPHARSILLDAFADLLLCDCVALSAARALHCSSHQMQAWPAVTKAFVAATAEQAIRRLSVVLGARHYLRQGHCWGIFQKIMRDAALTSVGHYSTVINLNHLAPQIRQMAQRRQPAACKLTEWIPQAEAVFSLSQPLPSFDPSQLSLFSRQGHDLAAGLQALSRQAGLLDSHFEQDLRALAAEVHNLEAALSGDPHPGFGKSALAFDLAQRYTLLHAAAACAGMWLHNRREQGGLAQSDWLAVALDRILTRFDPSRALAPRPWDDSLASSLIQLHRDDRLFSIVPLQLARRRLSAKECCDTAA